MNEVIVYMEDGKSFKGELIEVFPFGINKRWIKIKTRGKEIVINLLAVNSIHYPDNHPNHASKRN